MGKACGGAREAAKDKGRGGDGSRGASRTSGSQGVGFVGYGRGTTEKSRTAVFALDPGYELVPGDNKFSGLGLRGGMSLFFAGL